MTGTYTTNADYTTRKGAQALADKLNAYWHAQGHPTAKHWIIPVSANIAKHTSQAIIWTVRSNLVRGQPPKLDAKNQT